MAEEEAEHFAGCVGPERVRVRAVQAAAGPGVTAAVNDPLLQHRAAGHVGTNGPAIAMPAGYLAVFDGRSQFPPGRPSRLHHHMVTVGRMHCGVAVRVEYDRWNYSLRRLVS